MRSHSLRIAPHGALITICFAAIYLISGAVAVMGQESILADARYSTVSVLNLADQKVTDVVHSGYIDWSIVVGANPRLALVSSADYLSIVDLTIGREIRRIEGVGYGRSAVSSDGKLLLVADNNTFTLDVVDLVNFTIVKKIGLHSTLHSGCFPCGSIVVVGTQAYITSVATDFNHPAIAVVDLNTFSISAIPIPGGYVDGSSSFLTPNAAATADGNYVVMVETYYSDYSYHLLYISTATNTVVKDYAITTDPYGILVNPTANPQYAYILGSGNFLFSATVANLQTGELLPQTEVELDNFFYVSSTAAINPEGTRLVVGGELDAPVKPNPNLVVIDTGKMFSDPSHAIVGHATIADGVRPYGTAIAAVTTTPPPTAPTVTSVTPARVNNASANVIRITGANFAQGAQVRIGTMAPLPAKVLDQNHLKVTLPKNAPAQSKLDVIVTNPNRSAALADQYQSGLLPGSFTITSNPAFQPRNRFASFDVSDWTVAVYDFSQRHMNHVPTRLVSYSMGFNEDGAEIYCLSPGTRGLISSPKLLDYDPVRGIVQDQVSLGVPFVYEYLSQSKAAPSVNPATGKPVFYVPVTTNNNVTPSDLGVEMIDTQSGSPTFNQVINTIYAGLNSLLDVYGVVPTHDGKYVYVIYSENFFQFNLSVFDIVHNSVTSYDASTLDLAAAPPEMYVTPDGQSLLLQAADGSLDVFDITGNNATDPMLITNISNGRGYYQSWKVAGNRLFALWGRDAIIAYNFDRSNANFSELATYKLPKRTSNILATLTVSPDGALIYVPMTDYDMIMALDANVLVAGQDPLITEIGTPRGPFEVAVSPVPQSKEGSARRGH